MPLAREAAAALERQPGVGGLDLVRARITLANILDSAGYREEAAQRFAAALDLQREILGPDHPEVAFTEIPYGFIAQESRRYEEAERLLRHAAAVLRPLGHYELGSALRYSASP